MGLKVRSLEGEIWAPDDPSFAKPYFGKWMDQRIPSYSRENDGAEEKLTNTKKKKTQMRRVITRSGGKEC